MHDYPALYNETMKKKSVWADSWVNFTSLSPPKYFAQELHSFDYGLSQL